MNVLTRGEARLVASSRWVRERLGAVNPYLVDTLLALVSAAVSWWAVHNDDVRWPWWAYALAVGCSVPLPWRRRAPFAVFCASSTVSAVMGVYAHSAQPQISVYGILVIYTLADLGREWQRWLMLAILVPAQFLGTRSMNGMIFSEVTAVGSFLLGTAMRELRQLARVEADRAREVGLRAASDAARAVAEERGRIAREMHDILAHAVSLMVIQAEAGPLVVHRDPEKAVRTFDTIADAGRDAMVQLRRVLGVLKEEGAAPQLAPQPRLPELSAVAARVRAAGVEVRLELPEPLPALPADVEAAAYRIVQEALTNIIKHSGADAAEVRIASQGGELALAVRDNGRGPAGAAAERVSGWSGGRGLLGIRERAQLRRRGGEDPEPAVVQRDHHQDAPVGLEVVDRVALQVAL
ncbi:sensor histidine kinase, partial [Kitasatospora sp. LaBMicrA B282]|uniref:sensor histidine kinase n=1 Tax=Kitasatospora sp. LaBMicrA B282 TaxID=3420949 RepID=UPI003D0A5626